MRRLRFSMLAMALVGLAAAWPLPASGSVSDDVLKQTRGAAHDPDWPCIQRKVPQLSVAAVWQGPPVDEALAQWRDDAEVAGLAAELTSRRVPVEEAKQEIASFAAGLDADQRAEKLTLLFAGLFQRIDSERGEIIEGIERYARKQVVAAERIREAQSAISDLSAADPQRAAAMTEQLVTETRIFNERRQSLAFVCETPVIVEQRLFELARAIQAEIAKANP
jgi:hypothetical protein